MRRALLPAVLCAALAVLLAPVASLADDGAGLPIYPHTHHGGTAREPVNEKYAAKARRRTRNLERAEEALRRIGVTP
jgi:hypothetical protein